MARAVVVGRQPQQVRLVLPVHGEQQVEALEVRRPDLPAAQAGEVDAPRPRLGDAAAIGGVPGVPPGGAGGVDEHTLDPGVGEQPPHHALGGRRPADVAEADEQQRPRPGRPLHVLTTLARARSTNSRAPSASLSRRIVMPPSTVAPSPSTMATSLSRVLPGSSAYVT